MRHITRAAYVLGIIAMGAMAPVFAEQWQDLTIVESPKLAIDVDSIKPEGDYLIGLVREVDHGLRAVQKNGRFVMDCRNRRGAIVEMSTMTRSLEGTTQMRDYERRPDLTSNDFEDILPGTYGDAIFSFACTWQSIRVKAIDRLPLMR